MRTTASWALALSGLLISSFASAAESDVADASTPQVEAEPAPPKPARLPILGATADVGIPDGAGVSAVIRPWYWIRASLGVTHNSISPGIRAGLTLAPFRFAITPTLSLDVGHYFPGDANAVLQSIAGESASSPLLKNVAYDFGTAHLGVEIGSPKRFVFFLRGGVSYVQLSVPEAGAALGSATGGALDVAPPNVRFTIPSAKLGFVLYLI